MTVEIVLAIIIGCLFFVVIIVALGEYRVRMLIKNEVTYLVRTSNQVPAQKFSMIDLGGLPAPVQRYLKFAIINENQAFPRIARFKHTGTLRLKENQKAFPIRGEEFIAARPSGFVWHAKVNILPLIWVKGRDKYLNGKGNMLIKILSAFKIADGKGRDFDLGALIRWLSETAILPMTIASSQFIWEGINSSTAKLIVEDAGMRTQAIYHFNEKGEITDFISEDRPYVVDGKSNASKWTVKYRKYIRMGRFMIPTEIEAIWNLPTGDFSYALFLIDSVDYDPELF